MEIKKVTDASFAMYGRVIDSYDFTGMIDVMKEVPCPEEVAYIESVPELENARGASDIQRDLYGELAIEVGYCIGKNKKLNGLEYHRSSEVNIAVHDMILLLGKQWDITEDYTYDTSNVEAFLVPAGVAVEIYATTLHYAPCHATEEGFKSIVILPKGTNTPIDTSHQGGYDDKLLMAKNKWLLVHEEAKEDGAVVGLIGKNIEVKLEESMCKQ